MIAQDLANKRGISVEKVAEITNHNFEDLFNLY
jgi:Tat protein secretion system quality control protein TatD with DNase activity